MQAGADLTLNEELQVEQGQEQAPEANTLNSAQGETGEQRKDAVNHKTAIAGQDWLDQ